MTIAERIYSASTSENASPGRLAEKLARQIEDDIVSNNVLAGAAMGSLRQLSERYSTGRASAAKPLPCSNGEASAACDRALAAGLS